MRQGLVLLVLLCLVGCGGGSSARITKLTTSIETPTDFAKDRVWSAAMEAFSRDQKGVTGVFGLRPQPVQVKLEDGTSAARRMPVSWYEVDEEAGTIATDWLEIGSKQKDKYCDCPDVDGPGMEVTMVKIDTGVAARPQGSAVSVTTAYQLYKDDPRNPGKGETVVCKSRNELEQKLADMILERAKDMK